MLNSPKNKKWFGIRLSKLMSDDNWRIDEMKNFAQYLE